MDIKLSKTIGNRINASLALRKRQQKELAGYLGITPNTISYFVKGERTPNTAQLLSIAEYLEVSTDYLLGKSKAPTNDKDLQFVCDYTGLDMEVVQDLNNGITRIPNEGINFLMSRDNPSEKFFSMCCKLEDLKSAYNRLNKHKKKIIDTYENYVDNGESHFDLLDELNRIRDDKDLILFKLQMIMNSLAELYCKEEIAEEKELAKEYHRAYDFLFYGGALEWENCEPIDKE